MKKRLAQLLADALLVFLLPCMGCTKEPAPTDCPTLMVYMNLGTPKQEDLDAVAAALDAYTVEKLGVHVQLLPSLQSTYSYRQELKQRLYSGEQIDIAYCPSISDVFLLAGNGSLHPLDPLLQEYGSGVSALLEPEYYEFSRVDGKLYAMPAKRDLYQTSGFEYDKEIADRYGLDLSGVQTLSDLKAVFAE